MFLNFAAVFWLWLINAIAYFFLHSFSLDTKLMAAGVAGDGGADAQWHVMEGENAERDIALVHALQMVVKTVPAMEWKLWDATLNHVQVRLK